MDIGKGASGDSADTQKAAAAGGTAEDFKDPAACSEEFLESFVILDSPGQRQSKMADAKTDAGNDSPQADSGAQSEALMDAANREREEESQYHHYDPEDFNSNTMDEFRRSIVVENVPKGYDQSVKVLLENPNENGGEIDIFQRHGPHILVTFVDFDVAQGFIERKTIYVLREILRISPPELVEQEMSMLPTKRVPAEDTGIKADGQVVKELPTKRVPAEDTGIKADGQVVKDSKSAAETKRKEFFEPTLSATAPIVSQPTAGSVAPPSSVPVGKEQKLTGGTKVVDVEVRIKDRSMKKPGVGIGLDVSDVMIDVPESPGVKKKEPARSDSSSDESFHDTLTDTDDKVESSAAGIQKASSTKDTFSAGDAVNPEEKPPTVRDRCSMFEKQPEVPSKPQLTSRKSVNLGNQHHVPVAVSRALGAGSDVGSVKQKQEETKVTVTAAAAAKADMVDAKVSEAAARCTSANAEIDEKTRRYGGHVKVVDSKGFCNMPAMTTVANTGHDVKQRYLAKMSTAGEDQKKEEEQEWVMYVPDVEEEDMVDILVTFMESKRHGGGTIKRQSWDEPTRTLSVWFEQKEAYDGMCKLGSATLSKKTFQFLTSPRASALSPIGPASQTSPRSSASPEKTASPVTPGTAASPGSSAAAASSPEKTNKASRKPSDKKKKRKKNVEPPPPVPRPQTPESEEDDNFVEATSHVPPASDSRSPSSVSSPEISTSPEPIVEAETSAVLVEGIPASWKKDIVFQLFENKRRSNGGPIDHLEYKQEDGTAVITFVDPKVGDALIAARTVTCSGATLNVRRHSKTKPAPSAPSVTPPSAKLESPPAPGGSSAGNSGSAQQFNTVKVSNISSETSEAMLKMYFENPGRAGGGDIADMSFFADKGKAFIRFSDPKVALRVTQQPKHTLSNVQLRVVPREMPTPLPCLAVQLSGVVESQSEYIKLYFENKRSGIVPSECPVADVFFDFLRQTAVITFVCAQSAVNVVQRHPHDINKVSLRAALCVAAPPPPLVLGGVEDRRLLAKRLPPTTTLALLKGFLQGEAKAYLHLLTPCVKPSNMLLDFSAAPDYAALRALVSTRPFQGAMISIQRVPRTKMVQVEGFGDINEEFLAMYLERKACNEVGVVKVEMKSNKTVAIVEFEKTEDVSIILSAPRAAGDLPLHIKPYYPFIGLPTQPPPPEPQRDWPTRVTLSFLDFALQFIACSVELKEQIERDLAQSGCIVQWGKSVELIAVDEKNCAKDWDVKAKAVIQSYVEQLKPRKVDMKLEVLAQLKGKIEVYPNKTRLQIKCEGGTVHFIGLKKDADEFEKFIAASKTALEPQQLALAVSMAVKPCVLELLTLDRFFDRMRASKRGVKIELQAGEVCLTGTSKEIDEARTEILEKCLNLSNEILDLSPAIIQCLKREEMKKLVAHFIQSDKLMTVISFDEKEPKVFGLIPRDVKETIDLVKSHVELKTIPIDQQGQQLVKSTMWAQFVEGLLNQFKTASIMESSESASLLLCSESSSIESVTQRVVSFIEQNTLKQERKEMDRGYVRLIREHMRTDFERIDKILRNTGGRLECPADASCFALIGMRDAVKDASSELDDLTGRVIPADYPLTRMQSYFEERQGKDTLRGIERRHRVCIELDEDGSLASIVPGVDIDIKEQVEVGRGQFVLLVVGDITKRKVDSIVNMADGKLLLNENVVLKAAGPDVIHDCKNHEADNTTLLPGHIYVSKPGNLPCGSLIHTVGPAYRDGQHGEYQKLYAAVYAALAEAHKLRIRSVSMPTVTAAIPKFPVEMSRDIFFSAIKNFIAEHSESPLKEIFVIDQDAAVIDRYAAEVRNLQREEGPQNGALGPGPPGHRRRGTACPVPPPTSAASGAAAAAAAAASASRSLYKAGSKPEVIVTNEGINVMLFKGSIVKLKVDVIVNTCNVEINLNHGAVSKSILQAAGQAMQDECKKKRPSNFAHGDMMDTQGFGLMANFVYHGAVKAWDGGKGQSEQILRKLLQTILLKANSSGHTSIAMPAFGTGNLNFPHALVAEIMYDEVAKFSAANPRTALKDIRFVIYDKDTDSIKAFEAQSAHLTSPLSSAQRPTGLNLNSGPAAGSGIRAKIDFNARIQEAIIGSIKMFIKSGDITKEPGDAIINSTNPKLSLDAGAVSQSIGRVAGKGVRQECQNGKVNADGIFVSNGGDLPAKYIIHLVAGQNKTEWANVIGHALKEAERRRFSHIAFPLLGTGNKNSTPAGMAEIMLTAVDNFIADMKPVSLRSVVVCIFQQDMVKEFCDSIAAVARQPQQQQAAGGGAGAQGQGRTRAGPILFPTDPVTSPRRGVVLRIYALNEQAIRDAIKEVCEVVDRNTMESLLDGPSDVEKIKMLTEAQVRRIRNIQPENSTNLRIDVERTPLINRIRVQGGPQEVNAAMREIYEIFSEAGEKHRTKIEAEFIKKMAHWMYEDQGKFELYEDELNAIIERAFSERKELVEWEENSVRFRITFSTMQEECVGTPGDKVTVKRFSNELFPASWAQMDDAENLKVVTLDPATQEFKDVEKQARSTDQKAIKEIVKIERIQNKTLYRQYAVRKQDIDKVSRGPNERLLWHGTDSATTGSINGGGFNRSFCGKNATLYGKGVYFAANFSYSAQAMYSPPDTTTGVRHIYQSKVLTGDFTLGNSAYVVPPNKPPPATGAYDSVVDNIATPAIFVVFYDAQSYPEYLIYFK